MVIYIKYIYIYMAYFIYTFNFFFKKEDKSGVGAFTLDEYGLYFQRRNSPSLDNFSKSVSMNTPMETLCYLGGLVRSQTGWFFLSLQERAPRDHPILL